MRWREHLLKEENLIQKGKIKAGRQCPVRKDLKSHCCPPSAGREVVLGSRGLRTTMFCFHGAGTCKAASVQAPGFQTALKWILIKGFLQWGFQSLYLQWDFQWLCEVGWMKLGVVNKKRKALFSFQGVRRMIKKKHPVDGEAKIQKNKNNIGFQLQILISHTKNKQKIRSRN